MKSSLLFILMIPVVLVAFTACSSDGSGEQVDVNSTSYKQAQKREEIQTYLDSSDFETAIEMLENDKEYQDAYEDDDYKYNLGLAYAGSIGIDAEFIESMFANLDDNLTELSENNVTSISIIYYISYVITNDIRTLGTDFNIQDAKKASDLLEESSDVNCSSPNSNSNSDTVNIEEISTDACLLAGIIDFAVISKTFSYLGDITSLSSIDTSDEDIASSCAMAYAWDVNSTNPDCISIVEDTNITFENNATYTLLTVTMVDTSNTYDYLLTIPITGTTIRDTIRTNGYCTLEDFDTRLEVTHDTASSGYYVCPVNEASEEELTAEQLIAIEEFKLELIGDRNTSDGNTTITVEDIISYLNS